jgi:hypothetical protein
MPRCCLRTITVRSAQMPTHRNAGLTPRLSVHSFGPESCDFAGALGAVRDLLEIRPYGTTHRSHLNATGSADKKPPTELAFKSLDCHTERWLRHVASFRGAREVQLFADCQKIAHVLQFHVRVRSFRRISDQSISPLGRHTCARTGPGFGGSPELNGSSQLERIFEFLHRKLIKADSGVQFLDRRYRHRGRRRLGEVRARLHPKGKPDKHPGGRRDNNPDLHHWRLALHEAVPGAGYQNRNRLASPDRGMRKDIAIHKERWGGAASYGKM